MPKKKRVLLPVSPWDEQEWINHCSPEQLPKYTINIKTSFLFIFWVSIWTANNFKLKHMKFYMLQQERWYQRVLKHLSYEASCPNSYQASWIYAEQLLHKSLDLLHEVFNILTLYFYILKNCYIMYLKVACRQNIIVQYLRLA